MGSRREPPASVSAMRQLDEYFSGGHTAFEHPLDLTGIAFSLWNAMLKLSLDWRASASVLRLNMPVRESMRVARKPTTACGSEKQLWTRSSSVPHY
jgi:hypothetical protein